MKYALMLVVAVTMFLSSATFGQSAATGMPWDVTYKIPKGETRTIKGKKGKIIAIAYWNIEDCNYVNPLYFIKMSKKEVQTGEKVIFTIPITKPADNRLLMIRENEELVLEATTSILAYFSGYVYEVH